MNLGDRVVFESDEVIWASPSSNEKANLMLPSGLTGVIIGYRRAASNIPESLLYTVKLDEPVPDEILVWMDSVIGSTEEVEVSSLYIRLETEGEKQKRINRKSDSPGF
jgi:hypothetical protein